MTDLLRQFIREQLLEDYAKRQALAGELYSSTPFAAASRRSRSADWHDVVRAHMGAGRVLKKVFAKYADRSFLESVVTTHWFYTHQGLSNVTARDELSCIATLPGQFELGYVGAISAATLGMVVKGHITLLTNHMDILYTGRGGAYTEVDPARTRMSGANKGVKPQSPGTYVQHKAFPGLVLDKQDWQPVTSGPKNYYYNEALVDNWRPVAYVIQESPTATYEFARVEAQIMMEDGKIPEAEIVTLEEARQRF